jgi:hypothetical protein
MILQLMGINIISFIHCAEIPLVQRPLLVLLIPHTMSLDVPLDSSICTIANEFTLLQAVESIFLLISLTEGKIEANSTGHGNDSNRAIVPHEKRVLRETDEGLTERRGDGGGGEGNGLDSGFHVVGCFSVSVSAGVSIVVFQDIQDCGDRSNDLLKLGDGCQYFSHTNKTIGENLHPDRDVGATVYRGATQLVDSFAARRHLVDVVLSDTGRDHSQRTQNETSSNLLDWRQADTGLAKTWIDDKVHDGDDDLSRLLVQCLFCMCMVTYHDEYGIQLRYNIVGSASELHCGG